MIEESERVMKGTKHQEDWVIFHDALSLMTAVDTKQWMKQKGFLARWLLPSKDLYDNMDNLKGKYKTNPIGNSPEFMPWDAILNAGVHSSVDYHCLVAKDLEKINPVSSTRQPQRICSKHINGCLIPVQTAWFQLRLASARMFEGLSWPCTWSEQQMAA